MKIVILPGSIRKHSYNKMLANATAKLSSANVTVDVFTLDNIPMFNEDLEENLPDTIKAYYDKLGKADGFIFITPEYNRTYSGVLKNALDWASRKPFLSNKPVSVMGASVGHWGTARAQTHLKTLITELGMIPVIKNEVLVSDASKTFDKLGNLTDENVKKHITSQLGILIETIKIYSKPVSQE